MAKQFLSVPRKTLSTAVTIKVVFLHFILQFVKEWRVFNCCWTCPTAIKIAANLDQTPSDVIDMTRNEWTIEANGNYCRYWIRNQLYFSLLLFWRQFIQPGKTEQMTKTFSFCRHCRGLSTGFKFKYTVVRMCILQCCETELSAAPHGKSNLQAQKACKMTGYCDYRGFEWILVNAMQPFGVFENPSLATIAGLIPLPHCCCASLPVNICCSWPAVSAGRL